MGAEESKIKCQSPRCLQDTNSSSRCSAHQHNYSWYCKYCRAEDEAKEQEKQRQRQMEEQQRQLDDQNEKIAELQRKQEELQRELEYKRRGY